MKHTPGPWECSVYAEPIGDSQFGVKGSERKTLWSYRLYAHETDTEARAKAHLIAAAAEMLEALKAANRLLHFLENLGVFADLEGDEVSAKFAAWDILKAAIAKAEGR